MLRSPLSSMNTSTIAPGNQDNQTVDVTATEIQAAPSPPYPGINFFGWRIRNIRSELRPVGVAMRVTCCHKQFSISVRFMNPLRQRKEAFPPTRATASSWIGIRSG